MKLSMPHSGSRRLRILFGLPAGDFYADEFLCLAAASRADCRFIGYSWSAGRLVRRAGFPYQCVALWAHGRRWLRPFPPVAEYHTRGIAPSSVPPRMSAALGALADLVEAEIDRFAPDLVVFGPVEHAVCHLLYEVSQARGIATAGFQPCFLSGCFVLNQSGPEWEATLRSVSLAGAQTQSSALPSRPRNLKRAKHDWHSLCLRGVESALRLALGNNSFETARTLGSTALAKIIRPRWFPWLPRIPAKDLPREFVLITLHQPCLTWEDHDWRDLIEYCLAAVPSRYALVIRPHPTEAPQDARESWHAAFMERRVFVSDPDQEPGLDLLIDHCKVVFTLTSSTGFQALLRGKMVFTLAQAFYCRPGLARCVARESLDEFNEWLAAGSPGPDRGKVAEFDVWLRASCILPYPTTGTDSVNEVLSRLNTSAYV
jgi:hypothetical protein